MAEINFKISRDLQRTVTRMQ